MHVKAAAEQEYASVQTVWGNCYYCGVGLERGIKKLLHMQRARLIKGMRRRNLQLASYAAMGRKQIRT